MCHFFVSLNKKRSRKTPFLFFKRATFPFQKKVKLKKLSNINNMGNRTTTQKPPERETEQSQHLIIPFQTLKELPVSLSQSQCVPHKHELIICGGQSKRDCYSYDTLKNEYKFICEYPSDVKLWGHCVVKLIDKNNKDSNQITLLSFGGSEYIQRHTLVMKYVSVWSNISNKLKKSNNYNRWVPFTDNHNHPIIIGKDQDNYAGARAVIGGRNNHLLFITNQENISVFNLNNFNLLNMINYQLVILLIILTNKQSNQMLLFCQNTGLSIEYDEDNNTFKFHQLPVCKDIAPLYRYAYVCINDTILFFGGWNNNTFVSSKSVHQYLIRKKIWITFEYTLPIPLHNCSGILNEDNTYIHIIGESDHMKTKTSEWNISNLVIFIFFFFIMKSTNIPKDKIKLIIQHWNRILKIKLGWINDFNKIVIKYVRDFELLMLLKGHYDIVSSIRFSADGHKIVSASFDKTIRIWNIESGKQLQIFYGHTAVIYSVRFSTDGNSIISCAGDGTIRLWHINTNTEIMTFKSDFNEICDVNFSQNGKYIVSCSRDNIIQLWDIKSRKEIKQLLGHTNEVWSIEFSPYDEMILSASKDTTINLWDMQSGEKLKQFQGHSAGVIHAKFSPDGHFIASCSVDNTIRIWNIQTGKEWKIFKGHTDAVYDIKYFPDGQTIVSCSRDKTIRLWNVELGTSIQILKQNNCPCLDVSQKGNKIAAGSIKGEIRIWRH
ncbi:WD repeat-containing protein [Reticulomyxa filosa]|uniref:WD repeat-containing protein n=1 Tax=Reticulomyxa filosa TaxID=46433 RepID=X6MP87_RETFI|nr:WD repeat-containing protein [Reticulomyxa filosa]|eukprot:ETO15679.1 WD repeat-containing protein [Reticulomyxa filosa]